MTRARLRAEDGFTIIEAIVVAVIMVIGMFSLLAAQDAFRAKTSQNVVLEAATHEAQQELEYLRSLGYKELGAQRVTRGLDRLRRPARGHERVAVPPGHRYVRTRRSSSTRPPRARWPRAAPGAPETPQGRCTASSPRSPRAPPAAARSARKRVTVGVTYQFAGALHSVVLTTLVADPQQATADEITPPTTKPAQCPCWSTLFLYDTPASFADRQTPSTDHILQARNDHPDLMDETAPPNPYVTTRRRADRADALPLRDRPGGQRRPRHDVSRRGAHQAVRRLQRRRRQEEDRALDDAPRAREHRGDRQLHRGPLHEARRQPHRQGHRSASRSTTGRSTPSGKIGAKTKLALLGLDREPVPERTSPTR